MRGKLADAKVAHDKLQLGGHGQARSPDVPRSAPPQLHRAAGPAVLLLPVGEEARRQLHGSRTHLHQELVVAALSLDMTAYSAGLLSTEFRLTRRHLSIMHQ